MSATRLIEGRARRLGETTTGVHRLIEMMRAGKLKVPAFQRQ